VTRVQKALRTKTNDYVTASFAPRCEDAIADGASGLQARAATGTLIRTGSVQLSKGQLMNLTISGHHLDVTPALREYVINKLDRVTRHFDQVVDIAVVLSVEKQKEKERRQKAEVNLHVKGRDIHVEHANEDLYAAIDQLVDKLDRQVCRHKDRVQDHHHATAKRTEASA
jgi:putative sigma-54 modulation protein